MSDFRYPARLSSRSIHSGQTLCHEMPDGDAHPVRAGVVVSGWRPFGNGIVDDIWLSGAGAVMSPAFERGTA